MSDRKTVPPPTSDFQLWLSRNAPESTEEHIDLSTAANPDSAFAAYGKYVKRRLDQHIGIDGPSGTLLLKSPAASDYFHSFAKTAQIVPRSNIAQVKETEDHDLLPELLHELEARVRSMLKNIKRLQDDVAKRSGKVARHHLPITERSMADGESETISRRHAVARDGAEPLRRRF
jgi:hypothetical protein